MRQYLLDENVSRAYQTELLKNEPTLRVLRIGDENAPERGTSDPDILRWCETHNFNLVTNNRNSMSGHLTAHTDAGHHVPGIFTISPKARMNAVLEYLILMAYATSEEEYRDKITYIPL